MFQAEQTAAILAQEPAQAWWGETLPGIQQRKNVKALQPRLRQLASFNGLNFTHNLIIFFFGKKSSTINFNNIKII